MTSNGGTTKKIKHRLNKASRMAGTINFIPQRILQGMPKIITTAIYACGTSILNRKDENTIYNSYMGKTNAARNIRQNKGTRTDS